MDVQELNIDDYVPAYGIVASIRFDDKGVHIGFIDEKGLYATRFEYGYVIRV